MIEKVICVASHRRSGTHLTIDQVRANFKEVENFQVLDKVRKNHHSREKPELGKIKGGGIVKTHMIPSIEHYDVKKGYKKISKKILEESKAIYVARNGMDVMVSLYEYMKSFDEKVRNKEFSSFIRSEHSFEDVKMDRVEFWSYHVKKWVNKRDKNNMCIVRFEDWKKRFDRTIKKVSDHIGLKRRLVKSNMYKDLSNEGMMKKVLRKIMPSSFFTESTAIQFRKGKSGDRFEYFNSKDVEFFVEKAGHTLERLGYCIPDPKNY